LQANSTRRPSAGHVRERLIESPKPQTTRQEFRKRLTSLSGIPTNPKFLSQFHYTSLLVIQALCDEAVNVSSTTSHSHAPRRKAETPSRTCTKDNSRKNNEVRPPSSHYTRHRTDAAKQRIWQARTHIRLVHQHGFGDFGVEDMHYRSRHGWADHSVGLGGSRVPQH